MARSHILRISALPGAAPYGFQGAGFDFASDFLL
jgi:hypothetical protein